MTLLVLDGNERSALAATRSVGAKAVSVYVGTNQYPCLSSNSKFCKRTFRYSILNGQYDGILDHVKQIGSKHSSVVLFPMTDRTMQFVLSRLGVIPSEIHIPFGTESSYHLLSDKIRLFRMCLKLGVSLPRSVFSEESKSIKSLIDHKGDFSYPVVIKPFRSVDPKECGGMKQRVRYARSGKDLARMVLSENISKSPFLIQERISGPGIGIFLLMYDGQVIGMFAHRRIREKPPSGGVSVLCESIEPPKKALEAAIRILREANWNGAAMVEFKWDQRDNIPKLMEVNARFWGSLQLAISAGVDFPYLLYRLAIGEKVEPVTRYKTGLRMRWELGDLDHLLLRLFKSNKELNLPPGAPSRTAVIRDFLKSFVDPHTHNEVFRWDDPFPFIFELKQYIRHLLFH